MPVLLKFLFILSMFTFISSVVSPIIMTFYYLYCCPYLCDVH